MTTRISAAGRRIALVLFNLGGPDDAESVKPFLFNLFNDPAIIGLSGIIRTPLAHLISSRRETSAQANYAMMNAGGGSPLLGQTRAQAQALETALSDRLDGDETRVFIAMRYWRPLTEQTAAEVAAYAPDEIVLLPLYPQFSTTTTRSSLRLWDRTYRGPGRSRSVCCYPQDSGWIEAQVATIRAALDQAGAQPMRLLFSAHGIPKKLVAAGDPYQEQVEATVAAIMARLGPLDHRICYQSRVGPLTWLGPSTPEAIEQAGRDSLGVVVVPVAFVSEHIETLVELDIEYRHLAKQTGVEPYLRTPTVSAASVFIDGLAEAVVEALGRDGIAPIGSGCRRNWAACPCQNGLH